MSSYPPPTQGNDLRFNPANFQGLFEGLSIADGDKRYLRLSGGSISGSLSIAGTCDVGSLTIGGSALDLSAITGVVAGTATNEKALILGPTGNISGIGTLSATIIQGLTRIETESTSTSLITSSTVCDSYGLHLHSALSASNGIYGGSAIAFNNAVGDNVPLSAIWLDKIASGNGELVIATRNGTTCLERARFTSAGLIVVGTVSATTIIGTLSTAAQTNITSLGTLSGLTIGGNLTFTGASRTISGLSSISATTLIGTLSTAAQTNITSLGTLSSLSVSGSANLGSIQIAGTEIITNGRNIYNVGNITCSGTMNAFNGYQVNGSTFADASRNVFGASIIADYAQLAKTAGSTFSTSLRSNQYNLALSNASDASATFSGLAFHINTQDLSAATPSACITAEKDSATANDGADISFYTKGTAGLTTALTKRMMISKEGLVSIGSLFNGNGHLNILTEGSATMRFGAALTYRDSFSMSYFHNGPNNDLSRLSFSSYGLNSTLSIQHRRRVAINTDAPESTFHVVPVSPALFGSWERVQEWWNDNATPIKAGLIIYNENGGSNANGISFGSFTNDPINFMVNGSNGMTLNTSKRLNINRSSGPEATVHAGGMIWADEYFHSKQNVDGKAVYRTNWSQSNFLAWGTDATVGAMRLGICGSTFNWVSYVPVRGGAYTNASDRRIKRDIIDIPYGLSEVLRMQPRKFAMRNDQSQHVGFIAQEMLDIIPECVSGVESPNDELNEQGEPINPMGVDLASLTAVLCKAIQEQQAQIDELKSRLDNIANGSNPI